MARGENYESPSVLSSIFLSEIKKLWFFEGNIFLEILIFKGWLIDFYSDRCSLQLCIKIFSMLSKYVVWNIMYSNVVEVVCKVWVPLLFWYPACSYMDRKINNLCMQICQIYECKFEMRNAWYARRKFQYKFWIQNCENHQINFILFFMNSLL